MPGRELQGAGVQIVECTDRGSWLNNAPGALDKVPPVLTCITSSGGEVMDRYPRQFSN